MLDILRDWLPLGLILLAYREMGWFALPHHLSLLESQWVGWDRFVLDHGGRAVVESLGPVLPSILEMAYGLVYALPPCGLAILYFNRRRDAAGQFVTVVLLSVLLCYAQFPFWPSEPPRVVFAGLDLPSYNTIFRRFNLWMLGNYGIHTSVFPSAHVAGALSTAFGLRLAMPERKGVFRVFSGIAVLIAIATVYGRYHYLADAACGAVIASIVPLLATLSRREPCSACETEAPFLVSRPRNGSDGCGVGSASLSFTHPFALGRAPTVAPQTEERKQTSFLNRQTARDIEPIDSD